MKVFKNELKMLVATEREKYHNIKPNYSNYTTIDVLANQIPVYAIVDCKANKLPANFEFTLNRNIRDVTILISYEHKFP
jgi:hypothetical protein